MLICECPDETHAPVAQPTFIRDAAHGFGDVIPVASNLDLEAAERGERVWCYQCVDAGHDVTASAAHDG